MISKTEHVGHTSKNLIIMLCLGLSRVSDVCHLQPFLIVCYDVFQF